MGNQAKYPDNSELYDSSILRIKKSTLDKLNTDSLNKFKKYYIEGNDTTYYKWRTNGGRPLVNFTCEKIRHFKFPDNRVAFYGYYPIN